MPADTRLNLSVNEVETTIAKAAAGAGWPPGYAEDAGALAAWLCARGEDGIGLVLDALTPFAAPRPPAQDGSDTWVFPPGTPLPTALAAAGFIRDGTVEVETPETPLFVLAAAGICGIAADWRDSEGRAGTVGPSDLSMPDGAPVGTLCLSASDTPASAAPCPIRIDCPATLWARAQAMAVRSYVPASETSRAGAGAGDTDND